MIFLCNFWGKLFLNIALPILFSFCFLLFFSFKTCYWAFASFKISYWVLYWIFLELSTPIEIYINFQTFILGFLSKIYSFFNIWLKIHFNLFNISLTRPNISSHFSIFFQWNNSKLQKIMVFFHKFSFRFPSNKD